MSGKTIHLFNANGLCNIFSYVERIYILEVCQHKQLFNSCIVSHIPVFVRIRISPFSSSHAEQCNVQYIGFISIDKRPLLGCEFVWNLNAISL